VHNQPDTKSNPNLQSNPTTNQHAIVSIQPNIVTCPTYPEKFNSVLLRRFYYFLVVIVTLHAKCGTGKCDCGWDYGKPQRTF